MNLLYDLGIGMYRLGIGIASFFNKKARHWISGRWSWEERLREGIQNGKDWIWFHCSSLGEFEQGRPLIEGIKAANPNQKILLTFFSPSGYEVRKGYLLADHIAYLPLDTAANAHRFLEIVQPKLVVFVKYDLWLHFIEETHRRGIHLVLISALVRQNSRFLTSILKNDYRKAFQAFSWIFTQDKSSQHLLEAFAATNRISMAGDTRFDRVVELPSRFQPLPEIEAFIHGRKCIVIGSPWPPDEAIVLPVIAQLRREDLCWIIAPHEIHPAHIDRQIAADSSKMAKHSQIHEAGSTADVLWIDNVGMLSSLYHYADIVYIGGGFGVGVHNTQEPAVYGNPVILGPNYAKFQEAVDMVRDGGAKSVSDAAGLKAAILLWLEDGPLMAKIRAQNVAYIQSKNGATQAILSKLKIMHYLPEADLPQDLMS
jgi:3-deoxy-D-manno-octulosonic-acid transferase